MWSQDNTVHFSLAMLPDKDLVPDARGLQVHSCMQVALAEGRGLEKFFHLKILGCKS